MSTRFRGAPQIGSLVIALVAGIAGISASYLLAGATARFIGVPVNAALVDAMPAPIVTFSILALGSVGEALGFVLALAVVLLLFGGATLAAMGLADRPLESSVFAALFSWILATIVTAAPISSLGAAGAVGAAVGILDYHGQSGLGDGSRRQMLKALGGALGFSAISYVVGSRAHSGPGSAQDLVDSLGWAAERKGEVRQQIQRNIEEAGSKSLDVDNLQGLVSPIEEFYEVDINYIDPSVGAANWQLTVTGAVENEFSLTYDELTRMTPTHRFVTLRCVSDPVNGDLMDTALWTGVPVQPLLDRANPHGEFVVLRARDGYYVEFPIEALEGGLLAYGMNGIVLPDDHGFPVRALVLGHWGEVNVKWLTDIEVSTSKVIGYWEKRGWHGTGPVHTVAKLSTVNYLADGRVQIAGHAYAGTRGIQTVQVSVDGGDTWAEATLSEPLAGRDTWRQWSYEWSPSSGHPTVVVRAIDGRGTVQPQETQQPHPSGATGWVTKRITL